MTPINRALRKIRSVHFLKPILLATVASSALLATPSFAMNFTYSVIGENEDALSVNMTGEIIFGDATRFFVFVKTLPSLPITVFNLNSPGGNVNEAGIMGDSIRGSKIATAVINGHTCASACFMMFAAGVHRYATPDAHIAVHSAGDEDTGNESFASYTLDIAMARTLRAWGVPPEIVGKLVTTRNSDAYWLDMDDLRSMGVVILDNSPALVPSVPSTPPATLSSMFQRGLTDRTTWEEWFNSLTGDYRAGAEYWAGQRSLPHPGTCYGSADFNAGCVEARERLAPSDYLRRTEPNYKLGWNAYGH